MSSSIRINRGYHHDKRVVPSSKSHLPARSIRQAAWHSGGILLSAGRRVPDKPWILARCFPQWARPPEPGSSRSALESVTCGIRFYMCLCLFMEMVSTHKATTLRLQHQSTSDLTEEWIWSQIETRNVGVDSSMLFWYEAGPDREAGYCDTSTHVHTIRRFIYKCSCHFWLNAAAVAFAWQDCTASSSIASHPPDREKASQTIQRQNKNFATCRTLHMICVLQGLRPGKTCFGRRFKPSTKSTKHSDSGMKRIQKEVGWGIQHH